MSSYFGKPPRLPGEVEEQRRARRAYEQERRLQAAVARIDRIPGERERLAAERFLLEEDRVLAQLDRLAIVDPGNESRRGHLEQRAAEFRRFADEQLKAMEGARRMSRDKARTLRKAFRDQYATIAAKYKESQSERYPAAYRQREGAAILKELSLLEATLSRDMLLWHYGQRVEAARLRQQDPPLDAAGETRRLREQLEVASLAEQYPTRAQARNFLLPQARVALSGGNVDRARVFFDAARRVQAYDGDLERDINATLDRVVPHRRQAVEIEVIAADELELARRDAAAAKVGHEIGSPLEQIRASNIVQMADYKRQREAPILKEEHGIDLPPAID